MEVDGQPLPGGKGPDHVQALAVLREALELHGNALAHGAVVLLPEDAADRLREDVPDDPAGHVPALHDLVLGALVDEGEAPVVVEVEHAVGGGGQHLSHPQCGVVDLLAQLRLAFEVGGHVVEGLAEDGDLGTDLDGVGAGGMGARAPAPGRLDQVVDRSAQKHRRLPSHRTARMNARPPAMRPSEASMARSMGAIAAALSTPTERNRPVGGALTGE